MLILCTGPEVLDKNIFIFRFSKRDIWNRYFVWYLQLKDGNRYEFIEVYERIQEEEEEEEEEDGRTFVFKTFNQRKPLLK